MKKIMILGAGILQLPAIKKAKKMGLEVIAVDMDSDAIGFKEDGVICENVSTIDSEKILEIAEKRKIDGIMTLASDMPMRSVAIVANKMGLVGISEDTALKATNKIEMRKCLKEHNVPIPQFFSVNSKEDYLQAIGIFQKEGIKCIVKPVDNSGSRGVDLLSSFNSQEVINATYEYSKQYSRSGGVVVEEYMEGHEVSVETISIDGVCNVIQITDKLTTGAPYFVEMGHNEPSMLLDDEKKYIAKVAVTAVEAIGIKNGPSHTEIKVTKEGPKIVEIGARLGGDNITTHLVPLSTGVDMVESCIKIALGEIPDINKKFHKGSAIRYFSANDGTIRAIHNLDKAYKIPGVKQISFVKEIGDSLHGIKSSVDRIGFVICQNNNASEAIDACEQAKKIIDVEVY